MIELFMTIFDKNICIHAEDQSVIGDVAKTFDYFVCEKEDSFIDIDIYVEESSDNDYRIIYDGKLSACAKVNMIT